MQRFVVWIFALALALLRPALIPPAAASYGPCGAWPCVLHMTGGRGLESGGTANAYVEKYLEENCDADWVADNPESSGAVFNVFQVRRVYRAERCFHRFHDSWAGTPLAFGLGLAGMRAINQGSGAAAPVIPGQPWFNINWVVIAGQSLSTGGTSTPTTTTQPHSNVMIADALVTWQATTAFAAHSWVSPGNKFSYTNATSCTSGSGPTWGTSLGGTTSDGSCTWTNDHALHDDVVNLNEPWVANAGSYTASSDGATYLHPTGQPCIEQLISGSGPSAGSQPTWVETVGSSTTDNAFTWRCFFQGLPGSSWIPGGAFGTNDISTTANLGSYSFVPYVEPPRSNGWNGAQYPRNIQGETLGASSINSVTAFSATAGVSPWVLGASDTGLGGQALSVIQKGGTGNNYAAGIWEVGLAKAIATAQGKTFGVPWVLLDHGQADASNTGYAAGLTTLQANYDADIRAITGQSQHVVMIVNQQSSTPLSLTPWSTSNLPVSAYQVDLAANASGGLIVDAGPQYATPQNATDQHKPASGYIQDGEKDAEVMWTLAQGLTWLPLQPHGGGKNAGAYVYNAGLKTVTITFDVPYPPLAFDTSIVALNHQSVYTEWANGFGFEPYDSSGHVTVTSASIVGSTVVLQLSGTIHTGLTITYASTGDASTAAAGGYGGQPGGHYGNLRDSDPKVGPSSGAHLYNWCILFQSPALTLLDMLDAPVANDWLDAPVANDNSTIARSEAA